MAIRRTLSRRLFDDPFRAKPAIDDFPRSVRLSPTVIPPNAAKSNFHREYLTSPDYISTRFFRRLFGGGALYQSPMGLPELRSKPFSDMLKENLRGINITGNRICLEGFNPPVPEPPAVNSPYGISVEDARKILKLLHLQKLKRKLRDVPKNSIPYPDFIKICIQSCGNDDQGIEFAEKLDESGSVIILGNIVYLRPEQVARSMEMFMSESAPASEKVEEVKKMEKEEARIEEKAKSMVRGELYCGLGYVIIQTAAFMRLTFWELSWDVMEPICFFVTSIHFALGYGFFLRTSSEPSFNGYFQSRVSARKKKLMAVHKFDVDKYNRLRKACFGCS